MERVADAACAAHLRRCARTRIVGPAWKERQTRGRGQQSSAPFRCSLLACHRCIKASEVGEVGKRFANAVAMQRRDDMECCSAPSASSILLAAEWLGSDSFPFWSPVQFPHVATFFLHSERRDGTRQPQRWRERVCAYDLHPRPSLALQHGVRWADRSEGRQFKSGYCARLAKLSLQESCATW